MFGALASGVTKVINRLESDDVASTISVLKTLGIKIIEKDHNVTEVFGNDNKNFKIPDRPLDMGNSGTSTRLLTGILTGMGINSKIIGDNSLSKRPMKRITEPLTEIGGHLRTVDNHLPITIFPSTLNKNIHQTLKVGSAQVKSALLLAGLVAGSDTYITDPFNTRNHTEKMLPQFGVELTKSNNIIHIPADQSLKATTIEVPGDISSAAFWIVAGLITPNSKLVIKNVGINPTRTGILTILKKMGGNITIDQKNNIGEPIADITVKTSQLQGITIGGEIIPSLIDEIPLIVLIATQAKGQTIIKDAQELRFKETDRIKTVYEELNKLQAKIIPTDDGFIVNGKTSLIADHLHVCGHGDHRIAMMLSIAALVTKGSIILDDEDCVNVSYPSFFNDLKGIL
jgi:3-phosphoshikimate 1-carboxyvinyltransferase